MERVLQKMARQLNAYDEASLMSLWEKYATVVQNFEPTKRWEEAALVFGLIQSLRWKNQLFNHHWAEQSRPAPGGATLDAVDPFEVHGRAEDPGEEDAIDVSERSPGPIAVRGSDAGPGGRDQAGKGAKVLRFRPRKGD